MFYTIENERDSEYLRAGSDVKNMQWTKDAEQSRTFGNFASADQTALYWSQALGVTLSVVRYDGAWIKTAERLVVERHG